MSSVWEFHSHIQVPGAVEAVLAKFFKCLVVVKFKTGDVDVKAAEHVKNIRAEVRRIELER